MNCFHLKPVIMNNSKQEINQRLNYSKINKELNWSPKTKINKGISRLLVGIKNTIDF